MIVVSVWNAAFEMQDESIPIAVGVSGDTAMRWVRIVVSAPPSAGPLPRPMASNSSSSSCVQSAAVRKSSLACSASEDALPCFFEFIHF